MLLVAARAETGGCRIEYPYRVAARVPTLRSRGCETPATRHYVLVRIECSFNAMETGHPTHSFAGASLFLITDTDAGYGFD